jgi:hypothetical protein
LVASLDGGLTPGQTGRLTVGRKIASRVFLFTIKTLLRSGDQYAYALFGIQVTNNWFPLFVAKMYCQINICLSVFLTLIHYLFPFRCALLKDTATM